MIVKDKYFTEDMPLIHKSLGAYAKRQKVSSKNISNATSPYYMPCKVKFEEFFHTKEKVSGMKPESSESATLSLGKPTEDDVFPKKEGRYIPESEIMMSGESHVNLDKEMSELAQNQIRFQFSTTRAKDYFSEMEKAIKSF
jgi:flagellar basal-body rod protein FlgB